MREINEIIIHCTYTYPDMDIDAETIRKWHVEDNGWSDIGYHFVIKRDGTIEGGRPVERAGAHTKGHNANSIGVAMAGGKARTGELATNFTAKQWKSLEHLVRTLKNAYPIERVTGHNDYTKTKTCPTFDAKAWAEGL